MATKRKLAILIFDDVEVLDFCGPFEVFAVTRHPETGEELFDVYIVAEEKRPIIARNGLSVNPHYDLDDAPTPDIFLVPGGRGSRTVMNNPRVLTWINTHAPDAEQVLSVCTGSLILASAGLLRDKAATTYHTAFDLLREIDPTIETRQGTRYVDNGQIVTSAGISAGIDMSLYVVEKLHGKAQAQWTADHMEYEYYSGNID